MSRFIFVPLMFCFATFLCNPVKASPWWADTVEIESPFVVDTSAGDTIAEHGRPLAAPTTLEVVKAGVIAGLTEALADEMTPIDEPNLVIIYPCFPSPARDIAGLIETAQSFANAAQELAEAADMVLDVPPPPVPADEYSDEYVMEETAAPALEMPFSQTIASQWLGVEAVQRLERLAMRRLEAAAAMAEPEMLVIEPLEDADLSYYYESSEFTLVYEGIAADVEMMEGVMLSQPTFYAVSKAAVQSMADAVVEAVNDILSGRIGIRVAAEAASMQE